LLSLRQLAHTCIVLLSFPDALPIYTVTWQRQPPVVIPARGILVRLEPLDDLEDGHEAVVRPCTARVPAFLRHVDGEVADVQARRDRKSTRLNSSHGSISYDVFILQK